MELEPDPKLIAAAEKKRAKRKDRNPEVPCPKCETVCNSKSELNEHIIDEHPTGTFTPDKQDEYVELLRLSGTGRHTAARKIGITPTAIVKFIDLNPAFGRAVVMAEEEFTERMEQELYAAAMEREPWALKEVLKKRSAKRWGDAPQEINVNVSGTVTTEIEAGPRAARIAAIEQRLKSRALMAGENIIEAEVIDE